MKELIRSVVLAIVLMAIPGVIKAQDSAPEDFQQTLSKATLSVYRGKQVCEWKDAETFFGTIKYWSCGFKRDFTCTATVINRIGNEYVGLSAGHCIDWKDEKNYYVSSTVEAEPVLHNIQIVKSENDDRYDYVIFTFHSVRELPQIQVDLSGGVPALGTKVMTVHFAYGIGKQYTHGEVNSEPLDEESIGRKQRFMATTGTGPGASGSAIVDENTHKIIGLTEFGFGRGQLGTGAIPTGKRLLDFMDDDSAGLKPLPPPVQKYAPQEEKNWLLRIIKGFFFYIV